MLTRRRVLLAAILLLAACASPLRALGPLPAPETRITLLQINDVYTLDPVDEGRRGGFARLATLVKRLRAENPATLFALAGDTISPSVASMLLRGEQMIAGLDAVGLDLATFGNHEFDFGPAILAQRMRESAFTWTSANVLDRRTRRPFGGAQREVMLTLAGVRIGLFGLTTSETARSSSPGPDVEIADPLATGTALSAELRRDGARLVVALTHQHMAADRALAAAGDVDVILGGHEHEPLVAEEGKTLVTKAGSDARYLVQVDLWFGADGALRERSWTFHEVSARLPEDPRVAALARGYAERLGRELDVEVGRTTAPLEARRAPLRTRESNLADFVTDAMRARLGTDVALINGGGIRSDRVLPPGPLTRRDVAALLPFGNVVMVLDVSGERLREALEQGLGRLEREGGGFQQVSGLTLTFDPAGPPGRRIVALTVGDAPLDPQRHYTVAVVDYVALGGDEITALRDAKVLTDRASGPLAVDVVMQAIAARGTISPAVDGRLRAVER
ncbi:MAG TPA: bifunctional UDP-sugar hydrolase/5'-nucleotidase [Methylomirabilota bacterium]|nr:bifunctional UDP-sugar hydrolase/5'-nucleotidase [Methylomirabilota bacterium]